MTEALNRDRFLKVLALAESDQDGEALAAVRRAASMARAAGMSLGEAVASPVAPSPHTSIGAAWHAGYSTATVGVQDALAELVRLREEVAVLRLKRSRDERYQTGRSDGLQEGRARAEAEFAATDAYRVGYCAGHDAGAAAERAAVNSAYARGYADGRNSVNAKANGTRRGGRRAAG